MSTWRNEIVDAGARAAPERAGFRHNRTIDRRLM
jgi:hypothetical protein